MVQVCLIIADIIGIFGVFLCILASFILMAFSITFTVNETGRLTLLRRFLKFLKDNVVDQGKRYGYELLALGFILILVDRLISFLCVHCLPIFKSIWTSHISYFSLKSWPAIKSKNSLSPLRSNRWNFRFKEDSAYPRTLLENNFSDLERKLLDLVFHVCNFWENMELRIIVVFWIR